MTLTVACALWVGPGTRYTPAWVTRLRDMVAEHLPMRHRFVCLSNVSVPSVETRPLVTEWGRGWWSQVEVFNHAAPVGDRVIYLDLDVFVTGDLSPIATYPAPLAFMPPSHVFGGLRPRALPGVVRKYQASCHVCTPPAGAELFDDCGPEAVSRFRSGQDWIGYRLPNIPTMPPSWFAKAKQCREGVPPDVKIVLAHRVDLIGRSLDDVVAA